MGFQDRDYGRRPRGGGSHFGGSEGIAQVGNVGFVYPRWGSYSLWLILICVGMLLIDGIAGRAAGYPRRSPLGPVAEFFAFSLETTFAQLRVWELVTFQFQHAGLGHLFGNMLVLFFFGPMVESYWGSKRFLAFYLLSGIGGVVGYLLLWGIGLFDVSPGTPLVGASAGIFGILVAGLFVAPNMQVLLFFVIPVPLKFVVAAVLFFAAYVVLTGGQNVGGEAAHLGGAASGVILMYFPHLLDWAERLDRDRLRAMIEPGPRRGRRPRSRATNARPSGKRGEKRDASEKEVDRILQKVKEQGLHNLTPREKKTLQEATDRRRGGR